MVEILSINEDGTFVEYLALCLWKKCGEHFTNSFTYYSPMRSLTVSLFTDKDKRLRLRIMPEVTGLQADSLHLIPRKWWGFDLSMIIYVALC